eukprot:CAMPEP_0202895172 /NCGR_PEP_ID=MMETSP1392-20130828/4422_1 /ASSEMBLY_ACC=CAM_ASM_000868 /TAXON_ID=225041 /ORGANISM="Chlamydomonas chlamydogama, Strain SAG 11-48b" /LENGTH=363 /DNA_ID=CAMNT_0049580089 /DNA_START=94 /DNA_END=1185 /DNA_ORIENTATION=-
MLLQGSTPAGLHQYPARSQAGSKHCLANWHLNSSRHRLRIAPAASAAGGDASPDPSSSVPNAWWDSLNRKNIRGPQGDFSRQQQEQAPRSAMEELMGENGVKQWVEITKAERQRVWDAMRASARERYARGEMPDWFRPEWLDQQEAPLNQMLREAGYEEYQYDDTWLGNDDGSGNGKGKDGKGGKGWWREDDPYWPLRDWGDHPMRWWTFVFAGLLAAGGLLTFVRTGHAESLYVSGVCAAVLSTCAMAMSDMTSGQSGHLAVKISWATCALLAAKEYALGWTHRPVPLEVPQVFKKPVEQPSRLGGTGTVCLAMCALYMLTDMSGLDEHQLPANPGSVYKSADVAQKHRVWERYGYGGVAMR